MRCTLCRAGHVLLSGFLLDLVGALVHFLRALIRGSFGCLLYPVRGVFGGLGGGGARILAGLADIVARVFEITPGLVRVLRGRLRKYNGGGASQKKKASRDDK